MRIGGTTRPDVAGCAWLLPLLAIVALAAIALIASSARAQTLPPPVGDWVVADDTLIEGQEVKVRGNVTVTGTGNLTLVDADLVMVCDMPGELNITVLQGGRLSLRDRDHDPLTMTDATVVRSEDPDYHYLWFCDAGSHLLVSCSMVRDCGVPQPYRRGLIIDTSDALVEGSAFLFNNYGIYVRSSSPRIENSTFAHNEGYGLYEYQGAPTVQWCTFLDNFDTGAWVVSAAGARFSNCTFSDHSWAGMNVSASTLYVEDCTFHNNTRYGLRCYIGCRGTFARLDISVGEYVGLYLGQDCSPHVVDCAIHDLGGRGIWVYTARPLLERVEVRDCGEGLFLYNSDLRAESCAFERSDFNGILASDSSGFRVANCTIRDNGNNGILVGTAFTGPGTSKGAVVNCTITGNRRAGVFVYDRSSCLLVDANFTSNGIYALYCDGTGRADWEVTGDTWCINESVRIAGNITLRRNGNLTMVNTTVGFNATRDDQYQVYGYGGTLRMLDGDGDRFTIYDSTTFMTIQPPFGPRPRVHFRTDYGSLWYARNSFFLSVLVAGHCDLEGCEFQDGGGGVSFGYGSRVVNCSFSGCDVGVEVHSPPPDMPTNPITGCSFGRCREGITVVWANASVANCSFVTCRTGVSGRGRIQVQDVRFLNCAECVVVTGGTALVSDTQMRQSSGYGVRTEGADATLVGLLIDSSATKGLVANDSMVEVVSCQFSGNPLSAIASYRSSLRVRHTTLTGTDDTVVWLSGGSARLDDSYIGGPAKVVLFARSDAHIESYNTTMPSDLLVALDTSTIDVWWQFRVRVVVQGGLVPPPPVLVVVRDALGDAVFNATAAGDGSTPWVWAMQYHVTQAGTGARTPHAVAVTVAGTEFSSSFTLKARTDHIVTIPLLLEPRVAYSGPIDEGVEVAFDGSGSVGIPYPIVTWEWDPELSGEFVAKATGRVLKWAFAGNGQYEVALRVTDTQGLNNTTSVLVTVRDTAPMAFIVGQPPSGALEDQPVTLEGRYEATVDPVILQEWDFGDGAKERGATAVHAWTQPGTYEVRFSVVDLDGSTDTVAFTLNVTNVPPVAVAPTGPITVGKRVELLLDGARSHDTPSDNGTLSYVWQLGDGKTAQGAQVYHAYTRAGNYTVTLTVTDRHGASSAASVTVVVTDARPTLGAIPDLVLKDTDSDYEVALAGLIGDLDDDAANLTVTVSVAGSELVTATAHRNATTGWVLTVGPHEGEEGRARVTVTIADPDGGTAERTFNVTLTREGGLVPLLEEGWPWLLLIVVLIACAAIAMVVVSRRRRGREGAAG